MFDSFLAHLLVLFLLYISALRIFFLKNPRIDAAAVTSLFAFIASILTLLIWGFSLQSFMVSVLSLFFLLTNLRAIFRVASELFVDHYSVAFVITTVMELVLLIFVTFFVVYFRPVRYFPKDFSVNKEAINLMGSFANGFRIEREYTDKVKGAVTGKIFVYSPTEKIEWISSEESIFNRPLDKIESDLEKTETSEKDDVKIDSVNTSSSKKNSAFDAPILLFVGTPYGTVANYEPYFLFLAQKGFTVLAADFYPMDYKVFVDYRKSKFMKRFSFLRIFIQNEEMFGYLKPVVDDYTKKGYEALSRIALVNFRNDDGSQRKIFYITDGLDSDSIFSFSDKFSDRLAGIFQLDMIPEFKTSGFGFPEQTDLILAKKFNLKRDSEFFIPRYLSFKTIQKIAISGKTESKIESNIENKTENKED